MMKDLDFTFSRLWYSKEHHTARLAVLQPLEIRSIPTEDAYLQAYSDLLRRWRGLTRVLLANGWLGGFSGPLEGYLRNCCIPGVKYSALIKPYWFPKTCKRCEICPWCYMRRVSQIYDEISSSIFEDCRLVTCLGHKYYPVTKEPKLILDEARTLLLALSFGNTYKAVRSCKGLNWTVTLEEVTEGPYINNWKLVYRVIGVQKQLSYDIQAIPEKWKVKVYENPTLTDVSAAVSSVYQYPDGLFKGNPVNVVRIMEAREGKNMRLSETYGCFRGSKNVRNKSDEFAGIIDEA